MRPVTLFTGQCRPIHGTTRPLAKRMGYGGLELACRGDHFDVDTLDAKPGAAKGVPFTVNGFTGSSAIWRAPVRASADRIMRWRAQELMENQQGGDEGVLIKPAADGCLPLPASKAKVFGRKLAYREALNVLAPWRFVEDVAEWKVNVPAAGSYRVLVTLAADQVSAGNRFMVVASRDTLTGTVPDTGGYTIFAAHDAGVLSLEAGESRVVMQPQGTLRRELADVRGLRLVPVDTP